ncbi:hypothetical protein GJAV_G00002110 [Gymnothorax javanicus]|nr:hypothetical protein GJAV_G00002110 [Gymnothorax javanicus]
MRKTNSLAAATHLSAGLLVSRLELTESDILRRTEHAVFFPIPKSEFMESHPPFTHVTYSLKHSAPFVSNKYKLPTIAKTQTSPTLSRTVVIFTRKAGQRCTIR